MQFLIYFIFIIGMIFSNRFIQSKNLFMETMINLNDLLKYEILDLYSAEEQIIEALPAMIEKAKNLN